jgi:hypothetical chaperone protein
MSEPMAYGLDFGTSNSSIAVAFVDGSVEVIEPNPGSLVLPSLVYLGRGGARLAGDDALKAFLNVATMFHTCGSCDLVTWDRGQPYSACHQAHPGGRCLDSRLLSQVKSALADSSFSFTHSWGVNFELPDFVATVMRTLKRRADRHLGADIRKVVLGHPVRFAGAEGVDFKDKQELALGRLRQAAERAGFEDILILPESQAAVTVEGIKDGLVICADFGGGTFDTAVVDIDGSHIEVLALDGIAIGGEEFDGLIFDAVVRPAIGIDAEFVKQSGEIRMLPAGLRNGLRSLSGLKSLLNDEGVGQSLSSLSGLGHDPILKLIGELLYGGQAWAFFKAIEKAKIDLSSTPETMLTFQREWIDLNVTLDRETFDKLIDSTLQRARQCLEDTLAAAQVSADEVRYLTSTGGSSQIPAFRQLLDSTFPQAVRVESDPFTTVVKGLARYGWEAWAA